MSDPLRTRLLYLVDLVRPGPSTVELEASVKEFVSAMLEELTEHAVAPKPWCTRRAAVESVREHLAEHTMGPVNLMALASECGLSPFQLLRAFKCRFGLSPRVYQLHIRLSMARKLLRAGERPAAVAADLGFVDQSHLTRHFRRLLGVTPAAYARGVTVC
jgi:AraC-like DNA-binding protein